MMHSADETHRKLHSFSFLGVLPGWLQSLVPQRADIDVGPLQASAQETTRMLQRDALRYLMSRQSSSALGDCLTFGIDRPSLRGMSQVLRELRLDDVRVLAVDSTVTPAFRQAHWLRKASVVRIGRQAQTAAVLHSVEPLILEHAVLIFDTWNEHEEAFEEFLRAYPTMTANRLASDATLAQSFAVSRALTI
jgi:hypothetical protein